MSASTGDKLTDTRNAARPNSARVTSGRSAGGSALACDNLSGWPTASKVHFVTYKIDSNSAVVAGTQLDCYGIVSGNNIGSFTVVDGNDSGHAVGDVVEMLPTAAWGQDLADALSVGHTRTGAHASSLPLTAPILTTPVIADFTSATHTHANAAGGGQLTAPAIGTDSSWAWQSWTPTFANLTIGNAVLKCSYIQVGKTVIARVGIALGSTSSMGTAPTFTLPVTANSNYTNGQWLGSLRFVSNAVGYLGYAYFATTTTAFMTASTVQTTGLGLTDLAITSTVPNTWGTTGTIYGTITYEAA